MELQNMGPPDLSSTWHINFDGSKRVEGAGAGVILVSPQGDKMKYILRMTFPNASNNKAEYEACIHGMKMGKVCGATLLKIFSDSQLVAQQVMNKCDAVNDSMIAYKELYNELERLFDGCEVNHISRFSNDEADVLANIRSQCLSIPPGVFWEEISERSTKPKKMPKQSKKKEKPKKGSGAAAEPEANLSGDEEDPHEVMMLEVPWMQVYVAYIARNEIPDDPVEARRVIR
jgi:ribonuclease HI